MRKLMLIVPILFLIGCAPANHSLSSYPQEQKYNTEEPTLQSAEDAMKTKFDENSFNR